MGKLSNSLVLVGMPVDIPFTQEARPFVEFKIERLKMTVCLYSRHGEKHAIEFTMWEHTVYQLEQMRAVFQALCEGPFPQPIDIATPNSYIALETRLKTAVRLQLGLAIDDESSSELAYIVCSSYTVRLDPELNIVIGVSIFGNYVEAYVEPVRVREASEWLEDRLVELRAIAAGEER